MRYHSGLGVGHSYAQQASGESHQQSPDTSQAISIEEYRDQDEEHGDHSTSIPQFSELSPSSESAEEDSNEGSSSDYSLDFEDDDWDFGEDGSEESVLEEMYCY
jgi:hypothetical protein